MRMGDIRHEAQELFAGTVFCVPENEDHPVRGLIRLGERFSHYRQCIH